MPLTEEELASITDKINTTVNGATSNLKKLFELQRQKDSEASKETFGKLLDEKLAAFKPADPPPDDKNAGGDRKGKDLQISTLQKQIDDLKKSTQESNEKAQKAERRRREIERQSVLDGHLAKGGVTDPFLRELAISHFDRRGYVPWDEAVDGETALLWRGSDGVDVAFEEGMASWLKSDEAKRFLPPSGAGGSGGRRPPPKTVNGGTGKREPTYEDVGNFVMGLVNPALGTNSGE